MNGEYLKQLRKSKGMTQDELAKKLGYTDRSTISRLENNETNLTQDNIMKYSAIFEVSPLDILGIDDELSEDKRRLLAYYIMLNQDGKDELFKYLQYLISRYKG